MKRRWNTTLIGAAVTAAGYLVAILGAVHPAVSPIWAAILGEGLIAGGLVMITGRRPRDTLADPNNYAIIRRWNPRRDRPIRW